MQMFNITWVPCLLQIRRAGAVLWVFVCTRLKELLNLQVVRMKGREEREKEGRKRKKRGNIGKRGERKRKGERGRKEGGEEQRKDGRKGAQC
jgi:hypothetical protein